MSRFASRSNSPQPISRGCAGPGVARGRHMMRSLAVLFLLVGCVDQAGGEPTAANQLQTDDKADGGMVLWAGLTSVTLERYAQDPCDNGQHALGDAPIGYDEWVARARRGSQRVLRGVVAGDHGCRQPGLLEAARRPGPLTGSAMARGRCGTCRRSIGAATTAATRGRSTTRSDPMAMAQSLVAVGAPLAIESESKRLRADHEGPPGLLYRQRPRAEEPVGPCVRRPVRGPGPRADARREHPPATCCTTR